MNLFIKLIAALLLLSMLPISLFACNESDMSDGADQNTPTEDGSNDGTDKNETPTEKGSESDEEEVKLNLGIEFDKVKKLGRTTQLETGIALDHSAAGIEFCLKAEGEVKVELLVSGVKAGCRTTYFTVYIDGVRQNRRFSAGIGKSELVVAKFDELGEHTIRLVNQTESNYTLTEITNITFNGEILTPPAQKELFIEFIGDSLTCGMGNIGHNNSEDPQSPPWEDASQSYGYIIADELNADYSIVSESGIGIAGSWFDPLFDYYVKSSYSRDKERNHCFSDRTPDLIVINLGTNDYFLNKDKDPNMCKPEEVEVKTKEFIELVRACYGEDVPIIWAYGFVGVFLYDNIKAAIDSLGGEEAGIYMCKLPENTGGAQWHPNVEGHKNAAAVLLPEIKSILGI